MRKRNRIYWRQRGGEQRAYADFRDYKDVGGGREALVPKGAKLATTDAALAEILAGDRVRELEAKRRNRTLTGATGAYLGQFGTYHLKAKAEAGRTTDRYLANVERYLRQAVDYFGEDRALDSIGVRDIEAWMAHLEAQPNRRGETLSSATRRHHLNAVSNLYRRAIGEGVVPAGYNPAAGVMEKPQGRRFEADWLEVPEGALLLEAARTWKAEREDGEWRRDVTRAMYPILGTFLLTGGRKAEILGLDVEDISFDRRTVTFRPNRHRRLKTLKSHRVVPLWPQLERILRAWVFDADAPRGEGLLFPGRKGPGSMIHDFDKTLDLVAGRAGWEKGAIRSKMFRHTYCAARLQTVDQGAPVSPYTVARELGHGGLALVDRIYGHLGEVHHRSENVEYFVEDHRKQLGDRLERLGA